MFGHVMITHQASQFFETQCIMAKVTETNKNSSGDEIANVNFYVERPEATRIC